MAVVEPLGGSISNYGAKSLAGDMVTQLGGTLVKPEGNEMGKEDLVTLDPDVIFVVYMAYSGDDPETVMANQLAVIQEDPALASLSAVANIECISSCWGDMYASGPRTSDGIRTFAQGMYPPICSPDGSQTGSKRPASGRAPLYSHHHRAGGGTCILSAGGCDLWHHGSPLSDVYTVLLCRLRHALRAPPSRRRGRRAPPCTMWSG